ncbi:MAG: undecaprenyl-diphosphate phosphatase [Bacillota bacterium]|nr:undecaprenyl-diphosphate phosphatase [Bacillota bacterium]
MLTLSYWNALWFAIVQGITELFPVSSVAHAVLIPAIFPVPIDLDALLPFTVMLHLGTAFSLLLFYWKDWLSFLRSLFRQEATVARQVFWRVVLGTIPAAVLGFLLLDKLRAHFPSGSSAAFFLMVNGLILWIADGRRRRAPSFTPDADEEIARLSPLQSMGVGLAQSLALIPGFSRAGMTMVAGLYSGLSYSAAARFAFLLATPIILGAGLVEAPRLLDPQFQSVLGPSIVGAIGAGLAAYLAVTILVRYFHRHEVEAFRPFALYCLLVGAAAFTYLRFF